MTDAADRPFLPPGLELGHDDILEQVEELPEDDEVELPPIAEADAAPIATDDRVSGHDGIGTRREARERALALLYEAEQKGLDPMADVLDALPLATEAFAASLVVGVSDHRSELDELIGRYSVGWTVARMPAIDRTLLRLGAYELAHTDVPIGACISEAVELAKRYSTDDSHTFVNGLLSRLASELRPAER